MKTILFCRVSSREQEETGYSLPAQEKLLKEYSEKKEFKVAKTFSISESASGKYQRKSFDEMLNYVKKNNINLIICEKVDRLTRNLKDAVSINEWLNENAERQVHFVKENCILSKESKSNDKFIWNIKVSTAQYYIDNLSEEVKKGQKEKISQGWIPCRAKLGYKTIGEKGHKTHVLDENKAPLVSKMFELYASREYSLKNLSKKMFEEGLRTAGGNKLVKSRLHDLLSDPFYIGKIRWNNQITDGEQEPLIDNDTFEKVQEVLHKKSTPKYRKHYFLFTGTFKCAECGGTITWEEHKGKAYGYCNHYRGCLQVAGLNQDEAEEQIMKKMGDFRIDNPAIIEWVRDILKEDHKDEIECNEIALNNFRKEYDKIQKRLDGLYDDKLDGKITKDFYDKKFEQYTQEKNEVQKLIKKHSDLSDEYKELGGNIYDLSQKMVDVYAKAKTALKKRQMVNHVFEKLVLNKGELDHEYTEPYRAVLEAIRATNNSKVAKLGKEELKKFELPFLRTKEPFLGGSDACLITMLAKWDDFFKMSWLKDVKYPNLVLKQTKELLASD